MSADADADATTTATTELPPLIPSLPDHLAVNCLALVPRSQYPTLSLVSKSIWTELSSPVVFKTRSELHSTETFLYLSFRSPGSPPVFFSLNPQHQNGRTLTRLPSIRPAPLGAAYAAVGSTIYVLGGTINDNPSTNVWAFDCRFNRWERLPPMQTTRVCAAAGAVDGKIYVMGGCVAAWHEHGPWAEVFDPATRNWERVASPDYSDKWMHASSVVDGKIYGKAERRVIVYDARTGEWRSEDSERDMEWIGGECVVDGVLYYYNSIGKIRGRDLEEREWRDLSLVEGKLPSFLFGAKMANVGGNLLLVWEKDTSTEMHISCAEIRVEKRKGGRELWGKIEWVDEVGSVASGSSIVHFLAVVV